jgi:tryptophanyl-tRNA synthetase
MKKKLLEKFKKEYEIDTIRYSEFKLILAENIIEKLKPIREKRKQYENNPKIVEEILFESTKKARIVAKEILKKVKEKMFLDYFKNRV